MSGICSENSSCCNGIICWNNKNSGKNEADIKWNSFLWWRRKQNLFSAKGASLMFEPWAAPKDPMASAKVSAEGAFQSR
jgi:hypothetical protein